MTVMSCRDEYCIDQLLRKQLICATGRLSETELFSIMNSIQAICSYDSLQSYHGFRQCWNQHPSAIVASADATNNWFRTRGCGRCAVERHRAGPAPLFRYQRVRQKYAERRLATSQNGICFVRALDGKAMCN